MLINSNHIWKSSDWHLPPCELQVNLLNHVMGIYTARCLDFFFCFRQTSEYITLSENTSGSLCLQLFRRVAAALPGMDTTQDKSREDSILCVHMTVCVSDMKRFRRSLCSLTASPCPEENLRQHCDI